MNNVQTCPVRLLMVPRHVKPPEFDYDYEHRFAEHEHEDCGQAISGGTTMDSYFCFASLRLGVL